MPNYCLLVVAGHLTRDPEIRYTPKGVAVCNGSVAYNRTWKTESGEEKQDVTFIDFTIWNRAAETFCQYMRKGSPTLLSGYLGMQKWEDRETKAPRTKLIMTVTQFQFIGGKGDGEEEGREATAAGPTGRQTTTARDMASKAARGETTSAPPDDDSDIPF